MLVHCLHYQRFDTDTLQCFLQKYAGIPITACQTLQLLLVLLLSCAWPIVKCFETANGRVPSRKILSHDAMFTFVHIFKIK